MRRMDRVNAVLENLKTWSKKVMRAVRLLEFSGTLRRDEERTTEGDENVPSETRDPAVWNEERAGFRRRRYASYEDYLQHQKGKLGQVDLSGYHVEFRNHLRKRIEVLEITTRGDAVLCLGARLGTECIAFKDLGCFAVGIDLNPGDQNLHVLHGDFHKLQFPDGSVDHVFTNALDHVFELDQVICEVKRVLRPSGFFIAEIVRGSRDVDGREPGAFESYWWGSVEEVVSLIGRHGFSVEQRHRFSYPWQGDQIVFRYRAEAR